MDELLTEYNTPIELIKPVSIIDTTVHDPSTNPEFKYIDVFLWLGWTVRIINNTNQQIVFTLFGNFDKSNVNPQSYPATVTIVANSTGMITFNTPGSGWTPYVYGSVQASVAPTSGQISASLVLFNKQK